MKESWPGTDCYWDDGDVLFQTLRAEGRTVAIIPQRVRNDIWPVEFAASPLPEGETPKEGYLYT
eukprot:1603120-Pleurochrysis_carterae.AAC.1